MAVPRLDDDPVALAEHTRLLAARYFLAHWRAGDPRAATKTCARFGHDVGLRGVCGRCGSTQRIVIDRDEDGQADSRSLIARRDLWLQSRHG